MLRVEHKPALYSTTYPVLIYTGTAVFDKTQVLIKLDSQNLHARVWEMAFGTLLFGAH